MRGEYLRLRYAYAVLFALLTAEQLVSTILAASFGVQRRGAFLADVAVVPVLILWILHVPIWAVISRKPQPTRYIFETYSKNLIWFAFVAVLVAFAFFKAANVAKIKTVIPEIMPFYADPFLAQLDRAIFFTDPWKITHFFIGDAATWLIDQVYLSWHFVQIVFGCWMLLTRNLRQTMFTFMALDVVITSFFYMVAFIMALRTIPLFPRMLVYAWLIDVMMQVVIAKQVAAIGGVPEGVVPPLLALLEGNMTKVAISAVIWLPYLLLSERVNVTYRHRTDARGTQFS